MTNSELLDRIGEVKEEYVLAADSGVVRPRFPWKALAACAACAVLAVGAYSVWQMAQPIDGLIDEVVIPLHAYTVMEGGDATETAKEAVGAVADAESPDAAAPAAPGVDILEDVDGIGFGAAGAFSPNESGADSDQGDPDQGEASAQYDNLHKNGGISYYGGGSFPEWYGGAWLDNDWPDNTARLTVAIVDGFRTDELEAQILEWCGGTGDVLFCSAKYAYGHLQDLMERMTADAAFEQAWEGAHGGYGIVVEDNCIGLDIFADDVPEALLAALAQFDPDGDAIRVRVFTGQSINTDIVKGPAPDGSDG